MNRRRLILSTDPTADVKLVGGKAHHLLEMGRAGFCVPPWLCLTTEVFSTVAKRVLDKASTTVPHGSGIPGDIRQERIEVQRAFKRAGLTVEDRQLLRRACATTFPGDCLFAVRSSAVGEDSKASSFAGLFETQLCVTRDRLIDTILEIFATAYAPQVTLYRRLRGHEDAGTQVAVIVQQMVDSKVSGVMFTADPTTGDQTQAIITAGYGLGEGVVADQVETDTYFIDLKSSKVLQRRIGRKTSSIVFADQVGTGTCKQEVPQHKAELPALSAVQLHELVALGRRLQQTFGPPQDIEWALDENGRINLLQTRPITTIERQQIFDNSNIVESYPGLTLPLSFTFARRAYERTFRAASRTFGVPDTILGTRRSVHENLIALIDGRVYYNILNWYELFLMVPGFESVLPAWEKALGLPRRTVRAASKRRSFLQVRMLFRVVWLFMVRGRRIRHFSKLFERIRNRFRNQDLESLSPEELLDLYETSAQELGGPFCITAVNDFFGQQSFAWLAGLIRRFKLGDADLLRNQLLSGIEGMASVEPVKSVLLLVQRIRENHDLRQLIESERPEEQIWRVLQDDPKFAEFRASMAEHLRRYGDRMLAELKFEVPPCEENPAFMIGLFRSYLRGHKTADSLCDREIKTRQCVEQAISQKLRLRLFRSGLFGFVLRCCRSSLRDREHLRLIRAQAYGLVRRVFRELGCRLARTARIENSADIFYMSINEVADEVRGTSVTRNLHALLAQRKKEYREFEKRQLAHRIHTTGLVYARDFEAVEVRGPQTNQQRVEGGRELRGIGCSTGSAQASAKVIVDPNRAGDLNGEILVATATDPGWVFLMVASGGIIVERGNLLSHTAIVGRELGIPTVVGVKDATTLIREGDMVSIDGTSGHVSITPAYRDNHAVKQTA